MVTGKTRTNNRTIRSSFILKIKIKSWLNTTRNHNGRVLETLLEQMSIHDKEPLFTAVAETKKSFSS